MIRKIFVATTFSIAALGLSACNTIDGAQADVESVAEEVGDEI